MSEDSVSKDRQTDQYVYVSGSAGAEQTVHARETCPKIKSPSKATLKPLSVLFDDVDECSTCFADGAGETHTHPGREDTPTSLLIGEANSGKTHIAGRRGCLNSSQNANLHNRRSLDDIDRGENLDWCFYCDQLKEIYRLRAEVNSLERTIREGKTA